MSHSLAVNRLLESNRACHVSEVDCCENLHGVNITTSMSSSVEQTKLFVNDLESIKIYIRLLKFLFVRRTAV